MASTLVALHVDADDPALVARFWGDLLGWENAPGAGPDVVLLPSDDTGFALRFVPSEGPKAVQNRMHFDLTSQSLEEQQATVDRALALGGRHVDVGQLPDEEHVVLGDPEGNEFCVIEPGNTFLAECGFIGALAGDGTHRLGHFWSRALGWPLVWDQDEETAVRSPHGGPKVTWGGPPLMPRHGRERLRFHLGADGDVEAEVERLVGLGATRAGTEPDGDGTVEMLDPDGNEFTVGPR